MTNRPAGSSPGQCGVGRYHPIRYDSNGQVAEEVERASPPTMFSSREAFCSFAEPEDWPASEEGEAGLEEPPSLPEGCSGTFAKKWSSGKKSPT